MQIIYSKILDFLEKLETTKFGRFYYNLLLPIFAIAEYVTYKHFFGKVKEELFTSDKFLAFLDRNEFSYKRNCFYKMDVLPDTYLGQKDLPAIQNLIKNEIAFSIVKEIHQITPINVEQHLNVSVIIYDATREIPEKHYKAILRYDRYYLIMKNVWLVPLYFVILFGLIITTKFLIKLI